MKVIGIFGVLLYFSLITGCMSDAKYKNSIDINAPASIVFDVITDYESYPEILPMLHDTIKIISDVRTGNGVIWESTGTFKGFKVISAWKIIDYVQDKKIVMVDTKGELGKVILETESTAPDQTIYRVNYAIKMYKPFEQEFFDLYFHEMELIKKESESRYNYP